MRRRLKAIAAAAALIAPIVALATPASAQYAPYPHLVLEGPGWYNILGSSETLYENDLPDIWTIRAAGNNVESMQWSVTGDSDHRQKENQTPYFLDGDRQGDWNPIDWGPGVYNITAVGYSRDNQQGTASDPLTVTLTILAGDRPHVDFSVNSHADASDTNPGDGLCAAVIDGVPHCTLRAAVDESNASSGVQDIAVRPTWGDYQLTLGQLEITDHVGLTGVGLGATIRGLGDSEGRSRILDINTSEAGSGTTLVSNLRISNGGTSGDGGGVRITGSGVWLNNVDVVSNSAGQGGGIFIQDAGGKPSSVWLNALHVSDNYSRGSGGAVSSVNSDVAIFNSEIIRNRASKGGGVAILGGEFTVRNTLIAQNTSFNGGSGLNVENAEGTIDFTSIIDNETDAGGDAQRRTTSGGLWIDDPFAVDINASAIVDNVVTNTGGQSQAADCAGDLGRGLILGAGNYISVIDAYCVVDSVRGDDASTNSNFPAYVRETTSGPGGPTPTGPYVVPLVSPLRNLDTEADATCPGKDVYGNNRNTSGGCAAGAVAYIEGLTVESIANADADVPNLVEPQTLPQLDIGNLELPGSSIPELSTGLISLRG